MDLDIELRHLRYFLALSEDLHFGRAARRLGIAQPPLSQRIQRLETLLGCSLFERTSRRCGLTSAGRELMERLRPALRQVEDAVEAARSAGRGDTGRLVAGVPPSLMLSLLPRVIQRYRKDYPAVDLQLREMSTAALQDALRDGAVDIGFLREPDDDAAWQVRASFDEPTVAVLPSAHPAARRPKLRLRDLAGEPFVFFPRRLGPRFHDRLTSFCRDAGFTPAIAQEATQWQSIVGLVEAGLGVSLAPASVRKLDWTGVRYRLFPELKTAVRLCMRKGTPSPAGLCFARAAARSFRTTL